MSSKEEAKAQDKKTKKKKASKSAEGKSADNAEEHAVKEEPVKETTIPEKAESSQEETAAAAEENAEKGQPEVVGKPADNVPKETSVVPEPTPAEQPAEIKDNKKDDKSTKVTTMDLEKLVELKEAFSLFDFNHDGIIDLQDLKYTFASLGKPDFPEEEMKKMLKEAGEPCDFDAFVALFGYKVSILDPEDVFTGALATWDMRGVGMIPEERLKRDIRCFGDKFSGKETDHALEEAPVYVNEGTPMIDYAKFSNNICGFRNVERTRKYQKQIEEEEAHKYD